MTPDKDRPFRLITLEDYLPLIGEQAVARINAKANALRGQHMVHVNSTYYGGGVAEILSSLTLLLNASGVTTGWRVIQGRPDFFSITKKMHNALQGDPIELTDLKKIIYEEVVFENAVRMHLDHSLVVVHDPQPLPLIKFLDKHGPWVWRCHVDLTNPDPELWQYLRGFIDRYDEAVVSMPAYRQPTGTPWRVIAPAINPFSTTNRELTDAEIDERLAHYDIPTDLPLVTQVSRFDRWKDPKGVIQAHALACRETPATLVLVGNIATDDPEGQEIFESLLGFASDRVRILSCQDSALVNALQRRSTVVLQKSLREGFGLTVTEAMWKRAAVIGGNVGGIREQIRDGENGFLVDSVQQAAERIVQLIRNPALRQRLGEAARQTVTERFLLSRLMEDHLDLYTGLLG